MCVSIEHIDIMYIFSIMCICTYPHNLLAYHMHLVQYRYTIYTTYTTCSIFYLLYIYYISKSGVIWFDYW